MLILYDSAAQKPRAFADQSGATAVEYALIAAGIAVAIIAGVGLLGEELASFFNSLSSQI